MTSRIGINLLWLVPGVVGGSEESTTASLRALRELDDDDMAIRLFVNAALAGAHPDVVDAFDTEVLPWAGGSRALRVAAESSWLALRTRDLDLVHHAGGTAPPVRTSPYVLTVHDVQPLERDATHGRLKRAYLGVALPRSIRHARAVAVPSGFVKHTLMERLGADPRKLHVVHHGVTRWPGAEQAEVRRRYRIDGSVVLYPAITYPHKNHAVLVEAFARVLDEHPEAVLVLTGGADSSETSVMGLIDRRGIHEHVRRTGRIPAADLAALYEMASVVAVPSRYEGFGLPAAEAMAFGAPLVAADSTALPEIVGDAGVLVAPDDVVGWAEAIGRLLSDPAERQHLAVAGRARAQHFTWEANARALRALYGSALDGSPA